MNATSTITHADTQNARVRRLESMMLIRAYEEQLVELQRTGSPGTCTSVGQEASAVGVVDALDQRDRILTNHRSAAHLIARGAEPRRLIAEVLGRVDGYCSGRSGSLHIAAKELGVVLTSTIVGGELSMAPGVALAQKMGQLPEGGITAALFGDGAACEGIFHESVNLAVTWNLPLLYVCENNQWQAYVRRDETMPVEHVAQWVQGHGIACKVVDGNDVEAVHQATIEATAFIRATGKPFFLELTTYRQRGHFEPDDQAYVDPAELASWRGRDPIERQTRRLLEAGVLTDGELAHLQQRVAVVIDAALSFAQNSPWPDVRELTTDVYA
jgi:TPP-dependent pyruvate/acetoin dehydrogenase alpha subunit